MFLQMSARGSLANLRPVPQDNRRAPGAGEVEVRGEPFPLLLWSRPPTLLTPNVPPVNPCRLLHSIRLVFLIEKQ